VTTVVERPTTSGGRRRTNGRTGLPAGSPPRFPKKLPRGARLWDPTTSRWTESSTDGLWTCEFMQTTVRLTKGRRRGELIELRDWQADAICDILRLTSGGRRMYRTYGLLIARKNSKSLIGAGLALDGLFDEPGAEVYSCAGDKDQAKLVFREVVEAVAMSEELGGPTGKNGLLKVYRDAIEFPTLGSVYRALSSESRLKEGMNPSRVLFDELHAQRSDDLWNVMNQGSGTREQPLTIWMSTKGVAAYSDGSPSICFREYERLKRLMSGEEQDPTYGGRIYETVLRGRDYRDPRTWDDANPALGDFLFVEDMESKARSMPEADFKTKRLNIWVTNAKTWLPDGSLDKLKRPGRMYTESDDAVLFVDGSYNNDSTALVAWVLPAGDKPHLVLLGLWERPDQAPHDWHVNVPEVEQLMAWTCGLDDWDGAPIDTGAMDGAETVTRLNVLAIGFDKSRWQHTLTRCEERGLPVIDYPNSPERMVPATAGFYDDLMDPRGKFTWDGHPALARHFANAVTRLTSKGVMIFKRGARAKIDAAVAAVAGYDLATSTTPDTGSVYDERDVLVLGG
jgi:phage terminase large subunit-like protein